LADFLEKKIPKTINTPAPRKIDGSGTPAKSGKLIFVTRGESKILLARKIPSLPSVKLAKKPLDLH
jgi:hypothetical protein